MADDMPRADEVTNLTPLEVAEGLRAGRMLLVDVREPNETAVESYPDAVVVPLSIARGVQNKVLEAMAMARPVVLTPGAATGIEAEDGVHFAIGESDAALAAQVLALLANRGAAQAMGKAARQFTVKQRGWDAMLADLPAIMGFPKKHKRDAA